MDPARFKAFHHLVRKGGHFLGYGIFGYLWFRAFLQTFKSKTPLACAALAIACMFLIASLDEWHQSFSRERAGQFKDVVLDMGGALVFVSLALLAVARLRKTNIEAG
jgi:VanZ family protein